MIKAIIFDCFGVIIADVFRVMRADLRAKDPEIGREADDLVRANHRGFISSDETNRRMAALFGMSLEQFRTTLNEGEIKDHQLIEYIKELRRDYKTALLSNIGPASLHKRFNDQELSELFDTVVVSGEVGYAKPEPEIYQIAADRLGVRFDECLFTDDKEDFCEAARSTGMQAVTYRTFSEFQRELQQQLSVNRK